MTRANAKSRAAACVLVAVISGVGGVFGGGASLLVAACGSHPPFCSSNADCRAKADFATDGYGKCITTDNGEGACVGCSAGDADCQGSGGGTCSVPDVNCDMSNPNCPCGTSCQEVTTGNNKCTRGCSTNADCTSITFANGTPKTCINDVLFGSFCD